MQTLIKINHLNKYQSSSIVNSNIYFTRNDNLQLGLGPTILNTFKLTYVLNLKI
jgi:hypothetical protein